MAFIIMVIVRTLVIICGWAEQPELDPMKSGSGVLFQPQSTAVFSATTWYLAFEVDLKEIECEIQKICQLHKREQNLTQIIQKNVKMRDQYAISNSTVSKAVEQMNVEKRQLYTRLRGTLKNQTQISNQKRRRRSLFPFMGKVYNFLYGTATDEDFLSIRGQVDHLFSRQDRIISLQKTYLTTFKNIDNQLQRQQQQLQQEVNLTQSLFEILTGLRKEKDSTVQPLFHFVWQKELLTAIGEVRESFREYDHALNHMQLGYLSLNLLPPEQLQLALANIQQHLPSHLILAIGAGDQDIIRYYQLPLTRHIPNQNTIRGLVNVPLVNAGQLFNVYKAIPFPNHFAEEDNITGTHRFIWKNTPKFVAVTTDHAQFMNLGEYFSSDTCIKNDPQICPAQKQVTEESQDHCLYQLITGRLERKQENGQCEFQPYQEDNPVVEAVTDKLWAISVTKPMNLRISCLNPDRPEQTLKALPNLKVTSDHWLKLPHHCTATLGSKVIPLRLKLYTNMSTIVPRYISNTDPEQLMNLYGDSIQANKDKEQILNTILDKYRTMDPATTPPVMQLKENLESMKHQVTDLAKQQPIQHVHHVYGTLWGLLSLVGLGYCVYKGYRYWVNNHRNKIQIRIQTGVQTQTGNLQITNEPHMGSSGSVYREAL